MEFLLLTLAIVLISGLVKWIFDDDEDKVQQLEAENARLKKINRALVENDVLWGGLDKTVAPLPKYKPQPSIPGVNNLDDVIALQKNLVEVEQLKATASNSWWRSSSVSFTALGPQTISGSGTRVPYGYSTQYDEE